MVWQDNHAVFFLCEDRGSLRTISSRQWISRRIRVDFKKSVTWHSWLREVNTSAIELIMIASNLKKGLNSQFEWSALLSLPDHQQQWTLHRSDKQPHFDAIKVSNHTLSSGAVPRDDKYHEKFYTIKRGPNDIPEHPRHNIKVRIFPMTLTMRCYTLENFVRLNPSRWKWSVSFKRL